MPRKKETLGPSSPLKQILLALTLVPLIAGGVLILLWAFDVELWEPPDTQLTVAVLFIFLSFAASNLIQRNWLPAVGWFLLMLADAVLLSQLRGPTQMIAIGIGIAALLLFAVEIFHRLRSRTHTH
ncbi:MAG: hypothetical protein EHM41_20685 [Chloroflexi bacterium]|nr:MAG: hypothetical protein EHM41_20685 [Chloroflexota bacterium]